MIGTLALLRIREGYRRPFPYVAAAALFLVAVASRSFVAFSFGSEAQETTNLAISAVFLAGLLHAAFLGTAIVARDLERGTLELLLTKPLGPATYLLGTYLGLILCAAILCVFVGLSVTAYFLLSGTGAEAAIDLAQAVSGCLRALLPVFVLEAAALLASAMLPRVAAPLALFLFFVAASLAGGTFFGWLLPDFALFGLEAGAAPSVSYSALYAVLFCATILLLAYIVLGTRPALRSNH